MACPAHRTGSLLLVLVLLASGLGFAQGAEPSASAVLAEEAQAYLAGGDASAPFDAILTFHDASGPDRLAGLGVAFDRAEALPMARAQLTADQLRTVAGWSETRSVYPNEALELYLDESVALIGARSVWAGEGLDTGYDGTGVGVAVIDTGADGLHPDLQGRLKANYAVGGNPVSATPRQTQMVEGVQTDTEHGHGTHVLGTVGGSGAASEGRNAGVAPGADLYSFKAGVGPSVLTWWALRSFDWVLAHPEAGIRVISNSWGGGDGEDYDPEDPVNVASKAAYDQGIVVLFAASNSGGPDQLNRYAVSPHVVSVGASSKEDTLASFSSTGRPGGDWVRDGDGIYRPTLVAPGVDILAPRSSLGIVMSTGVDASNPFYTTADGTSMATPHVAGVVALMLDARPELTPAEVIAILEGTAKPLPQYEPWEVGAGRVDALAAVQAAEDGRVPKKAAVRPSTTDYALRLGSSFAGAVAPAGYTLKAVDESTIARFEVPVGEGVDALFAEIGWPSATDNLYLYLDDPSGREVASSAGLLDVGSVNYRAAAVTNPAPGTWTVRVEGRVNGPTDFHGFWGAYDEVRTKGGSPGATTNATTTYEGLLAPSVAAAHDSRHHTFEVPAGATQVDVTLAWATGVTDLDLYVYDPDGRPIGSSTNFVGESEHATITTGDPMTGALPPGTWTLEVRGYLNGPETYHGAATVTYVS